MNTQPEYTEAPALADIVAANIRVGASIRGINQSELARKMGISQSTLSLRWLGARAYTLDDIEKIAEIFGIWPWELTTPITDKNGDQPRLTAVSNMWYTARDSNPEPTD